MREEVRWVRNTVGQCPGGPPPPPCPAPTQHNDTRAERNTGCKKNRCAHRVPGRPGGRGSG
eukprot:15085370-Alexandrium_andersonii.AAC.1